MDKKQPVQCAIYISNAYDKALQTDIWNDVCKKLRIGQVGLSRFEYAPMRLVSHIRPGNWKPIYEGEGIVTQAERARMNLAPAQVIIIAHHLDRVTLPTYQTITGQIAEIRKGHPDSVIAVHMTHEGQRDTTRDMHYTFAFNAKAAGASLLYTSEPDDNRFKHALDAIVTRNVREPLVTPDFVRLPTDSTVQLGDVRIERKITPTGAVKGTLTNIHSGESIAGFPQQRILALWTLAAYQGSFVKSDALVGTGIGADRLADAKNKKLAVPIKGTIRDLMDHFRKAGWGKVQNIWGLGYLVEESDFRFKGYTAPTSQDVYPFVYHPDQRLISWSGSQVQLEPAEARLFEALIATPGIAVDKKTVFPTQSDNLIKVMMNKLRHKLTGVAPMHSDINIGLELIETARGFGFLIQSPAKFNETVKTHTEKARVAAVQKSRIFPPIP